MRFVRKLINISEKKGKYRVINIPTSLNDIFNTDLAIIEVLPNNDGITVRPIKIEAL